MNPKKPTAGIILAAGISKRFGKPKQLVKFKGKYLIEWVLDAALNSCLDKIILVLGHAHQRILDAVGEKAHTPFLQVVINPNFRKGQGSSLQVGFSKTRQTFPSVMFLLGDQPMVTSETIDRLLEAFWQSSKDICVPVYKGKRGTPTLFGRRMYDRFESIQGDMGARKIIQAHPDRILEVELNDPLCFFDIDTEKDIETLARLINDK
jgi:molybdenum cofactor cytidylyltransferase